MKNTTGALVRLNVSSVAGIYVIYIALKKGKIESVGIAKNNVGDKMRSKREFVSKCIQCGNTFTTKNRLKKLCSEKCEKERASELQRRYRKTHKKKHYKYTLKSIWKKRDKAFLLKRLDYTFIRMEVIKEILKEKFNFDIEKDNPNQLYREEIND